MIPLPKVQVTWSKGAKTRPSYAAGVSYVVYRVTYLSVVIIIIIIIKVFPQLPLIRR